jgi:hypothetical protein
MRKAMFSNIVPAAVLAIAASSPLQVSAFWSGPGCFIANMMTGGLVSGGVGFSLGGLGSRYGHVGGAIHPYGEGYPVGTLFPYGAGFPVSTLYPYGAGFPVSALHPREAVYYIGAQSTVETGSGWMSPVTPARTTPGTPRRAAELLEANVWAR